MAPQHNNESYSHRVDQNDTIVGVSENWQSYALENLGEDCCLPENIIGSSLWDHINDPGTSHLYKIILQKVRAYQHEATFQFRCDSPDERRYLKLRVVPRSDGCVDFISQTVKTESRKSVRLLRPDIQRSDELIRMCSMCKRIATSDTRWEEVETAVKELRLFEKELLPRLTHGVCPPCHDAAMAELEQWRPPENDGI